MRTRWKVSEDWITVGMFWFGFGWVPMALIGNVLTGGNSKHVTWGFVAGVGVVWGPPLLCFAHEFVRWLRTIGAPIRRVTKPVLTDLRDTER